MKLHKRRSIKIVLSSIGILLCSSVRAEHETTENDVGAQSAASVEVNVNNNGSQINAGPGVFVVDEEAATRALERSLIRSDALLLSPGHIELGFDLSYFFVQRSSPVQLEFTGQSENEVVSNIGESRNSVLNAGVFVDFKVGLIWDSQIEISIPYQYNFEMTATRFDAINLEMDKIKADGVNKVSFSILKTIVKESGRRPDLVAKISLGVDSGSISDELVGSANNELSVSLNATKRQDPLVFTYGFSYAVADESDSVKPGDIAQLYTSVHLAASPYTSLNFGFNQSYINALEIEGNRIAGSDVVIGTFSVGFSSVLGRNYFLSAGLNLGITETSNDYSVGFGISRRATIW